MITLEELLQIKPKGKWFLNGREITEGERQNLKSEADIIRQTALWKLLIKSGKYHARERVIREARTKEDLDKAQEFHRVVEFFEAFLQDITKK